MADSNLVAARPLIADLFEPRPAHYFIDFGLTWLTAASAFFTLQALPLTNPWAWGVLVVAAIAAYRAGMFVHELAHLPPTKFKKQFHFIWNGFWGIVILVPSFTYLPHSDHHHKHRYGTDHDGEYLAFQKSPWSILLYMCQPFFIPIAVFLRFLVMSPLAWLFPGVREWVHQHASTLVIDVSYVRPPADDDERRLILRQERFCFLLLVIGITLATIRGELLMVYFKTYLLAVLANMLNALRTLGSHRWSSDGGPMAYESQVTDSVNYPYHGWISELWGPIGTRYHALHHMFPALPYHSLGPAHRRLVAQLPADSVYHRTIARSLLYELIALWKTSMAKRRQPAETHPTEAA